MSFFQRARKDSIVRVIFVFLVSGASLSVSAASSYPVPYHSVDLIQKNVDWQYEDNLFSPVGWSKDGKLAYVHELHSEEDGTARFQWFIQDMATDKVLWDSGRSLDENFPQELVYAESDVAFRWEYEHMLPRYQKQLNKYGIVVSADLKISGFPLVRGQEEYRALLADLSRERKYGFEELAITKFNVLIARNATAKTVGRLTEAGLLWDLQIGGYIMSPYESRIAVVLCRVHRGWEGPPHPVGCQLVGCNLTTGF